MDRLRAIAARHGKSVAQLAIAWVLGNAAVTVALVGIRRTEELKQKVTSEALEPLGSDIHVIWRALTRPDRFKGVATEDLLSLVCANAPKPQTRDYLKLRYGNMA